MMVLSKSRRFAFIILAGLIIGSTRCRAARRTRDGAGGVAAMEAERPSTDGGELRATGREDDATAGDGNHMSETELSDLREQLVSLIDSILFPLGKRGRSRRDTTVGTFSEYFGSLNAGAYGNCTCRGDPGPTGPQGIPGRDGRDGRDASPACHDPAYRLPTRQPDAAASSERQSQATPTSDTVSSGDGVYVRWGRTVCREGSELVYEGVMAGTHFTHNGGASNHLCLPLDPIYDLVQPGSQSRALIYGVELETGGTPDSEWHNLHDNGPPCAVCLAPQRPTILMIPARNVCPSSNWTLEYKGQIMSGHHAHKRTEYICVDRHPEAIPGTSRDVNGAVLYLVEAICSHGNSLPCGPYIDGNELTCAVCSM